MMSRCEKKPDIALDEVVDRLWPYDGPHTPETVAAAARAVSGLVRYLNNATRQSAVPDAPSVHRVLAEVETAVFRLPQLLSQLQSAAERLVFNPTLYDDREDRVAANTAAELAENLRFACTDARVLGIQLNTAAQCSVHLGNEDPARPHEGGDRS